MCYRVEELYHVLKGGGAVPYLTGWRSCAISYRVEELYQAWAVRREGAYSLGDLVR